MLSTMEKCVQDKNYSQRFKILLKMSARFAINQACNLKQINGNILQCMKRARKKNRPMETTAWQNTYYQLLWVQDLPQVTHLVLCSHCIAITYFSTTNFTCSLCSARTAVCLPWSFSQFCSDDFETVLTQTGFVTTLQGISGQSYNTFYTLGECKIKCLNCIQPWWLSGIMNSKFK